jgi:hypothetical protein
LLDDRDERAGVKFKDADLVGFPTASMSARKRQKGRVELVTRSTATSQDVAIAEIAKRFQELRNANRHKAAGEGGVLIWQSKSKSYVQACCATPGAQHHPDRGGWHRLPAGLVVCESIFGYYYFKYRHIVDERLQKPLFEQTAKIYAAPKEYASGRS